LAAAKIQSPVLETLSCSTLRVTRLGDFSPVGWFCLDWVGFSKITELAQIYALLFPNVPAMYLCFKKGWATFGATFSQTHLVTLLTDCCGCSGYDPSFRAARL
jgi:hypothetical protein